MAYSANRRAKQTKDGPMPGALAAGKRATEVVTIITGPGAPQLPVTRAVGVEVARRDLKRTDRWWTLTWRCQHWSADDAGESTGPMKDRGQRGGVAPISRRKPASMR